MYAPVDDRRSQDREQGSGRRRAPRRRVLLAATLETPAGERTARLRNLSSTGAMIELDKPPAEGTEVVFKRPGISVRGIVVWASGSLIGMHFAAPIAEEDVMIQIGRRG
jgi:hypothetical protein